MGIRPTIKFTLESGLNNESTLDHRFLISDNEWITADKIKIGTKIGVPKYESFFGNISEQNAYKLGLNIDWEKYNKISLAKMLAGLFDKTGKCFSNKIVFSNMLKEVITSIQEILLKFGVHSVFKEKIIKKDIKEYKLYIYNKESCKLFYNTIISYSLNKYKLKKICKWIKTYKSNNTDLYFEKVVKIEYNIDYVYDLTIEKYHTYICNHMISHNCNAKLVKIGTPKSRNHFYESVNGKSSSEWCVIKKPFYECEQLWALNSVMLPDHTDPTHTRIKPYSTFVLGLMPKQLKMEWFSYVVNNPDEFDEKTQELINSDGEMSIADFNTQYLLEFADDISSFLSADEFAKLKNGDFQWQPFGLDDEIYFAGIDFADGTAANADSTAISIIRFDPKTKQKQKIFAIEFKGMSYPQQVREILRLFAGPRPRFKIKHICADYTSCGRAPIAMLMEYGLPITGIVYNAKDKLTNSGSNYKTAMFRAIRVEISNDKFKYPTLENFIATAGKDSISLYHRQLSEWSELVVSDKSGTGNVGGIDSINLAIRAANNNAGHDDIPNSDSLASFAASISARIRKMPTGTSYRMQR